MYKYHFTTRTTDRKRLATFPKLASLWPSQTNTALAAAVRSLQKFARMPPDPAKAKSVHSAAARADMDTLYQLLFPESTEESWGTPDLETLHAVTAAGWTLLHTAAQHDNDRVARLFVEGLDSGIDVNAKGNMSDTPLHVCAIFGSAHMAEWLLSRPSINPWLPDSEGWAPIHYAARFGHLELVDMLRKTELDRQADEVIKDTEDGSAEKELLTADKWTALHVAARFEQLDIMTLLLSNGTPKEARDKDGNTALHIAVKFGLMAAVVHLLNHRLDVEAKTLLGESPGHLALKHDHLPLVEVLLNHGMNLESRDKQGDTMLHFAARREHGSTAIEVLCNRAANLQAKNNKGWSALHIAANVGNLEAIRTLISHGADIDIRDNEGGSWLFLLHKDNYSQVTKFLVTADAGAEGATEGPRMVLKGTSLIYTQEAEEPAKNLACERHFTMIKYVSEIASGDGFNPHGEKAQELLHYACEYGHTELISFLLHQGTDVHKPDEEGMNAMHTAAKHGSTKVMDLLLEHNMSIDEADETGWTPLHHACCAGQNKTVQYLLHRSAKGNQQNHNGETPLHLAFGNGHMEIIRQLIEAEQADPQQDKNIKDNIGYTPMQYATIELAERMAGRDQDGAGGAQEEGGEPEAGPSRCVVS